MDFEVDMVLQGPTRCQIMFQMHDLPKTVGNGLVFQTKEGETIHTCVLPLNMAKVQVDNMVDDYVDLLATNLG